MAWPEPVRGENSSPVVLLDFVHHHLAVVPSGVYVIDAKRYKGKIEVRKPFFGDAKLVIGGRDKTKLIAGVPLLYPRRLAKQLRQPGELSAEKIGRIVGALAQRRLTKSLPDVDLRASFGRHCGATQPRRPPMPQILVVADRPQDAPSTVVYRERISTTDLESDHFSGQLVERVGWAVLDADQLEHEEVRPAPR